MTVRHRSNYVISGRRDDLEDARAARRLRRRGEGRVITTAAVADGNAIRQVARKL